MMPFSDIHISQGSVAIRLRCGGVFKRNFVANLLPSPSVKNFENRLIFGKVMDGQEFGVLFFWLTV